MSKESENDNQRGEETGSETGGVAQQSGQSITMPKRASEHCSNQFWTVSSLVAIKRRAPWKDREGSMPSTRRRKREPRRTAAIEEENWRRKYVRAELGEGWRVKRAAREAQLSMKKREKTR